MSNSAQDIFLDWENGQMWDNSINVVLDWNAKTLLTNVGPAVTVDWQNRILSGQWNVESLQISGKSVGGSSSSIDETYLVHKTGAETISGNKAFVNDGILSGNWEVGTIRGLSGYFQTGLNVVGRIIQGYQTTAPGDYSHAEGMGTKSLGKYSHAEGLNTTAYGQYSHAEGNYSFSSGLYSHAEGVNTTALGDYSHAEGDNCFAIGHGAHAEGYSCYATGIISHAEGAYCKSSGEGSHAEGYSTHAIGQYSHAEGLLTISSGSHSHAEGLETISRGTAAHAQGYRTLAYGEISFAAGKGTVASGDYQTTFGHYNVPNTSSILIIGNGIDDSNRSNIVNIHDSQVDIGGGLDVSTILAVPIISDSLFGDTRIDILTRQLYNSQPYASVDWENHRLGHDGVTTVDWNSNTLSGTWDVQDLTLAGKKLPFVAKYSNITGTRTGSYNVFTTTSPYILNSLKIETVRSSGIFTNSGFAFNLSGSRNEIVIDNTRVPIYSSGLHSGRFVSYEADLFANIVSGGSIVRFNITSGATGLANGLNLINVYAEGFYT
jgi:hypothetical protein